MSVEEILTGEVVHLLDADEARRLTNEIRQDMAIARVRIVKLVQGRGWLALGYPTFDEYIAAEFDGPMLPMPKDERVPMVAALRAIGMSNRTIATTLGVNEKTVRNDASGADISAPDAVVGADGKTYPAQQPERAEDRGAGGADDSDASEPDPRDCDPPAPHPHTTQSGGDDASDPAGDATPSGDGADSHDVGQPLVESPPTAGERPAGTEPQAQQPGGPDPTDAVHDLLDTDAELGLLQWRETFTERCKAITRLKVYDPIDVAAKATPEWLDDLAGIVDRLNGWWEQIDLDAQLAVRSKQRDASTKALGALRRLIVLLDKHPSAPTVGAALAAEGVSLDQWLAA